MNQTILSLLDTYEDLIEIQQDLISCNKGSNTQSYRLFLQEKRDELISVLQKYKSKLDHIYLELN